MDINDNLVEDNNSECDVEHSDKILQQENSTEMEDIGITESKGETDNNIENMEDIESKCLCWWCSINIKQQNLFFQLI